MNTSSLVIVLFCISAVVFAAPFKGVSKGVVGGSTIFVDTNAYTTPAGLQGPVTISVDTVLTSDIQICVSAGANVVGADLADVCDPQSFASLTNTTTAELKFTRKSFSAFSSTKRVAGSTRFVAEDDDSNSKTIFLAPSTDYYITALTKSSTADLITITLDGDVCEAGMGEGCVEPNADPFTDATSVNVTVPAGSYYYFQASVPEHTGAVAFTSEQIDDGDEENVVSIYAAPYYLPTQNDHAQVYQDDDDGVSTITIENPFGPTWYVGLYNSGNENHVVTVSVNATVCEGNMFGRDCAYGLNNITALNAANLTQVLESEGDDEDLVFYQITNTHCCGVPDDATHVRVSAAPTGNGKAPTLLARQGAPPSISFHQFNASGQYVNQLILPIIPKTADDASFVSYAWYVGVLGEKDYKIWSGGNCANNCSNEKNGNCSCNGNECNVKNLYTLPVSTEDSFGQCQCNSDKYSNYDCTSTASSSSSSSSFQTIYIVLIAVGGAIVLAVAIGVPVYCYLQNRRKHNYERV